MCSVKPYDICTDSEIIKMCKFLLPYIRNWSEHGTICSCTTQSAEWHSNKRSSEYVLVKVAKQREKPLKSGRLVNDNTITLHLLSLYEGKHSDKGMNNISCFLYLMKIHASIYNTL